MIEREYAVLRAAIRDALRAYQVMKWHREARRAIRDLNYSRAEFALAMLDRLKDD